MIGETNKNPQYAQPPRVIGALARDAGLQGVVLVPLALLARRVQ